MDEFVNSVVWFFKEMTVYFILYQGGGIQLRPNKNTNKNIEKKYF